MVVTVSELNSYVKEFFDANPLFNRIYVKGELSNFKHHSSGHCYMSLKDDKSSIKAVMFKFNAMKLGFRPEDGMKVIVCARVSVYERDGVYQLYIEEMQPDGIGALHIQFEQLKEKLNKEGLFGEANKKKLPEYPTVIGVVTSTTGAAVRDIINVIKRRNEKCNIIIYPALVQGDGAAETIASGIEYFNENPVDVIIIGRGGGSQEDLWCFNEEIVARAVFNSKIPVVSAVGHETDYTISDFVSDLRAPTPSAAAEISVPELSEIKSFINMSAERMKLALLNNVRRNKERLLSVKKRNAFMFPERLTEKYNQELTDNFEKLIFAYKNKITAEREIFIKNISKLDSLSPLKVLKRGYSFVENEQGEIIDTVSKIKVDDKLTLKLSDGTAKCVISEVSL